MKKIILILSIAFIAMSSYAQPQKQTSNVVKAGSENGIYELFPTENYWTFIKLDTRNGKMWQVHFTIEEDGFRGESLLNAIPLVIKEKEIIGRYTLYPTENFYNFLLLDQIDGNVFQVQWSKELENRLVVPIE